LRRQPFLSENDDGLVRAVAATNLATAIVEVALVPAERSAFLGSIRRIQLGLRTRLHRHMPLQSAIFAEPRVSG
jgi:hypothetical protein